MCIGFPECSSIKQIVFKDSSVSTKTIRQRNNPRNFNQLRLFFKLSSATNWIYLTLLSVISPPKSTRIYNSTYSKDSYSPKFYIFFRIIHTYKVWLKNNDTNFFNQTFYFFQNQYYPLHNSFLLYNINHRDWVRVIGGLMNHKLPQCCRRLD